MYASAIKTFECNCTFSSHHIISLETRRGTACNTTLSCCRSVSGLRRWFTGSMGICISQDDLGQVASMREAHVNHNCSSQRREAAFTQAAAPSRIPTDEAAAAMAPEHRPKALGKKRCGDSGQHHQQLSGMSFTSVLPSVFGEPSSANTVMISAALMEAHEQRNHVLPTAVTNSSNESSYPPGRAVKDDTHRNSGRSHAGGRSPRPAAAHCGDLSPPPCAATCATPSLEAPAGMTAPLAFLDELQLESRLPSDTSI